jgi:hypothetical protein
MVLGEQYAGWGFKLPAGYMWVTSGVIVVSIQLVFL